MIPQFALDCCMVNTQRLKAFMMFLLRSAASVLILLMAFSCATQKPELEKFHVSARVKALDYPDSPAVVLLDRTELVFTYSAEKSRPYAEQLHTRRIQILTADALDLVRPTISYDNRSAIFHIQARRIGPDGQVEVMMSDRFLNVSRFRKGSMAEKLYPGNGYKQTKISNVRVGDVIEYSYLRVYRDPRWVDPISVSGEFPVVRGEVIVDYPKQFDVSYRVSRAAKRVDIKPVKLPSRIKSVEEKGEGVSGHRLTFLFENEKAIFPEENMANLKAVAVQVHPQLRGYTLGGKKYQAYSSWDDVARWYSELVGTSDQPDAEVAQLIRDLGGNGGRKREKLKRVQHYLQNSVADVPAFLNLAALPVREPKEIIKAQLGDAKDQASLGLAMLRQMEVDGFPVLVSRLGSNAFLQDLTTPSPFNHVLIAVPSGGKYSFIDPSSPDLPTGRLPGELQGQTGLLLRGKGQNTRAEIVQLPIDPPQANTRKIAIQISLAKNGLATGQAIVTLDGLDAAHVRRILKNPGDDMKSQLRSFLEYGAESKLKWAEVSVVNGAKARDADATLKMQIVYGASDIGMTRAEGFAVDMASMIGKPLAQAWRDVRYWPMVFPYQFKHELSINISLPEGMGVVNLPAPSHIDTNQLKAHDLWSVADGSIFMEHDLELKTRLIYPEDYRRFRQALQMVWAGEAWPIDIVSGGERGGNYGDSPF
jgi:hypothetical protein